MATIQSFTAGQVLTAQQMSDLQGYVGVVQVKSAIKTDTFTTTSVSLVDVTGLSVAITPTSASNKILVMLTVSCGADDSVTSFGLQLVRGATLIAQGDAAGVRDRVTAQGANVNINNTFTLARNFLDSPATTSATTYKIQIRSATAGQTASVNRSINDIDNSALSRTVSTITVMEVTP